MAVAGVPSIMLRSRASGRALAAVAAFAALVLVVSACGTRASRPRDGGPDGGECLAEGASCETRDQCCAGLDCCSDVPVPPGAEYCGSPCPMSDRNLKEGFRPVDADAVLEGVVSLPITGWRYRDDPRAAPHVGPMAQDFHATFGVGVDDRFIAQVDGDGVALLAIQALERRVAALVEEDVALRGELERLRRRLDAAEAGLCGE